MSFREKQHTIEEEKGGGFGDPYSADEYQYLQASLTRKLGPEYVSRRSGPGGFSVSYIESWKAIELANEIFGFNGWSSCIRSVIIDFLDENKETNRVSLGLSVVVRVTIKDGAYHEDIGYGSIDNCRGKASAFEKCKKEGTTDALKRALRNFGNSLGNCMYDKYYLREIGKMKPPAYQLDSGDLFRKSESGSRGEFMKKRNAPSKSNNRPVVKNEKSFHPSATNPRQENRDPEMYSDEELDNIFVEDDMIAHLAVNDTGSPANKSFEESDVKPKPEPVKPASKPIQRNNTYPMAGAPHSSNEKMKPSGPSLPPKVDELSLNGTSPSSAKFISARAAAAAEGAVSAPNTANFNPRLDSPSIRKSSVVDHSKSVPVHRSVVKPAEKVHIRPSAKVGAPPNASSEQRNSSGTKRSLHETTLFRQNSMETSNGNSMSGSETIPKLSQDDPGNDKKPKTN
ncbi:DNA recombination mediator Rad52 (previously Rad22) [Schizosaccharomyces osmophilus]|uniref:DNA recombination mediator Rad52 (Previously Rad22) n=1 Tax=Schizosaccharomyces osmophilus TaxID=2545709 RepID=A0AAF0AUL2_9SCHI|nr:DNA recombination mediator Rad52 (previously Rad22) [Schizosaccharomyces osmophilus]WBW71508.1 DNA recombination mediator Rad52 (previously Rad22) [Schizosaccharomyces osmophilus]